MNIAKAEEVGALLVELGTDIAEGRVTDALETSKKLIDMGVDMLPVDDLKGSLSDQDRRWVDLAVDIAETRKLDAAADAAEKAKTE